MRWRRVYLDGRCTDCKQPEEAHGRGGIDCPSPVSEPLSTVPFDETGARERAAEHAFSKGDLDT